MPGSNGATRRAKVFECENREGQPTASQRTADPAGHQVATRPRGRLRCCVSTPRRRTTKPTAKMPKTAGQVNPVLIINYTIRYFSEFKFCHNIK